MKEAPYHQFMATTAAIAEGRLVLAPEAAKSVLDVQCKTLEADIETSDNDWSKDALFVFYSWADERLQMSDWGRRVHLVPMQMRYFHTSHGGELFFTHLRRLVKAYLGATGTDKVKVKRVLKVYAICLSAGFKGAFYDGSGARLNQVRQKLLRTLADKPALNRHLELQVDADTGFHVSARFTWIAAGVGAIALAGVFVFYQAMLFQQIPA